MPFDGAILCKEEVMSASGHLKSFFDEFVNCLNCNLRIKRELVTSFDVNNDPFFTCLNCNKSNPFLVKRFNLMFKTDQSALENKQQSLYLRPETAPGMIINYKKISHLLGKKLPFGLAQVGKSFRNEVAFGNFTFRIKEFEQMEVEFFFHPQLDNID
jgi:glycyl-tRNA synthetase